MLVPDETCLTWPTHITNAATSDTSTVVSPTTEPVTNALPPVTPMATHTIASDILIDPILKQNQPQQLFGPTICHSTVSNVLGSSRTAICGRRVLKVWQEGEINRLTIIRNMIVFLFCLLEIL